MFIDGLTPPLSLHLSPHGHQALSRTVTVWRKIVIAIVVPCQSVVMFPNSWVDDNVINKLESVKHSEDGKKKMENGLHNTLKSTS